MKQARYSPECSGHFGLAAKYYCHFTSPIRRYPDLQIHRIIKEHLHGRLDEKRIQHYERILSSVADSCSKNERRADEAEREVDKLKKVQYMTKRIGEEYEGVISSITSWGIYVELPNTIEGMVSVTTMVDDYYYYEEETYQMIGKDTHKEYHLGQSVRIRVKNADMDTRTIDFELVEDAPQA
jgi:ribonuclease R